MQTEQGGRPAIVQATRPEPRHDNTIGTAVEAQQETAEEDTQRHTGLC